MSSFALPAGAGDPAIQETNGLFSVKLGYLRSHGGALFQNQFDRMSRDYDVSE